MLNIDVHGALAVTEQFPDAITIFVRPSSLDELERRLRGRGTESDEIIRRRLQTAKKNWNWPIDTATRSSTTTSTWQSNK